MYYRISKNEKNLFFGKKIAQVWAVTLSIEAISTDPEQTAPLGLIWVHIDCHRGFLNISADEKSRWICCDWPIKG